MTMGKYGQAALRATDLIASGKYSPVDAWRISATEIFAHAPESMKKVCPREAFFGLHAAGLLFGIRNHDIGTTSLTPNRSYAVKAVELLVKQSALAHTSKVELWRKVLVELGADCSKAHNQQMDVVLSLWDGGKIVGGPGNRN